MTTAGAVVLVNGGSTGGASETTSKGTVSVRVLRDGPEGTVRDDARNHQWALMTRGMHVCPVFVDPAGAPVGLVREHLDEAIGRYFQGLEPYGTWEEAPKDRRRGFRRGLFTPFAEPRRPGRRREVPPGGLRSMFRELRKVRERTGTRKAARVTAIEATAEQENGETVYVMTWR